MGGQKVCEAAAFKKAISAVFHKFDADKSGEISCDELTLALCHVHIKLSRYAPGALAEAPTPTRVSELLCSADVDESGGLSLPEFERVAALWFQNRLPRMAIAVIASAAVTMLVVPEVAVVTHRVVPLLGFIPRPAFKVMFLIGTC